MLSWWNERCLQLYMDHVAKMEALERVVKGINDSWDFSEQKKKKKMLQNAPGPHHR